MRYGDSLDAEAPDVTDVFDMLRSEAALPPSDLIGVEDTSGSDLNEDSFRTEFG